MRLTSLKKRLGDILVDVGIITPAQLKEALDTQKRTGGKLGTILSQMGVINEEVMLAFLGKQCGVSYVSLAEYGEIPAEVLRSVPETIVRHQNLIPIARDGATLTVAMSDPFNIFAVDDVKLMTGYEVQVVIASELEIKSAIERYYAHQPEMEDLLLGVTRKSAGYTEDELLQAFFDLVEGARASDVYFEPQLELVRVRFKIDGALQEQSRLSKELADIIVKQLKAAGRCDEKPQGPFSGKVTVRMGEHRRILHLSVIPAVLGERVTLRLQDRAPHTFDLNKLGFEPETLSLYRRNISQASGLVLLTGPAGSGKTATLYATIAALNYPDRDILSIEDPVECIVPGITQVEFNGIRGEGFPAVLRELLHQDPDIVMIGEIRDGETAFAACDAALGGKMVFATMLSSSPREALDRLRWLGLKPPVISSSLAMIVNQRLLRTICPHCKESYEIPAPNLKGSGIESLPQGTDNKISLWKGRGCPQCGMTGYLGRTGAYEVLALNERLRGLITGNAPESALREDLLNEGQATLEKTVLHKLLSGVTTVEEVMRLTKPPVA
ncbi:MAG: GspE/PulE family protein [Endomicrobiales bacterium]